MTKSSRRKSALVAGMALVVSGWLWAGLSEGPGKASERAALDQSTSSTSADEGWMWSGANERQASYRWAEDKTTRIASPAADERGAYLWDDSLEVADQPDAGDSQ